MTSPSGPAGTGLVDIGRLLQLRARLQAVGEALEGSADPGIRRRVSYRVEHIANLAPEDLDAAEAALDRLEWGMSSQGLLR